MSALPADRRATGSYYTPPDAAHAIAHWVLRAPGERVLEPSFGDGVFLRAIRDVAAARRLSTVDVTGVELAAPAHGAAVAAGLLAADRALCADFLGVPPAPVDAVVGNPPYVRLRHLAAAPRRVALDAAATVLRAQMEPSGSVWMPFTLHASRFLTRGGRLALVLPFEITHVRYARPMWEHLAKSFGSLRVCRIHERLFPDILQDVVILYADDHGAGTTEVSFELYERVADFARDRPAHRATVPVDDILAGRKPFTAAMLPSATVDVLAALAPSTVPVAQLCAVHIGYVAGDKSFFHPGPETVARHGLSHLRPSLTSARSLRRAGLHTSGVPAPDRLLSLSASDVPSPGEAEYLRAGEQAGVSGRYKCRVRQPWYAVPGVRTPDVLLSVFSASPLLLVNDAGYAASNSLLCGYLRDGVTAAEFALSWYTPLTLLETELRVHSLGGGVLILIPGEVNAVRVRQPGPVDSTAVERLDLALRSGTPEDAYRVAPGLTGAEIEALDAGTRVLRRWRVRGGAGSTGTQLTA